MRHYTLAIASWEKLPAAQCNRRALCACVCNRAICELKLGTSCQSPCLPCRYTLLECQPPRESHTQGSCACVLCVAILSVLLIPHATCGAGKYGEAKQDADAALSLDADNVKAHYRGAVAAFHLGELQVCPRDGFRVRIRVHKQCPSFRRARMS